MIKWRLHATLAFGGPLPSVPRSDFRAHFPGSDRGGIGPGSTSESAAGPWTMAWAGWSEHKTGRGLFGSRCQSLCVGKAPGSCSRRATSWGWSLCGQDFNTASLQGPTAEWLWPVCHLPATPVSSSERPTRQTPVGRAVCCLPPPSTISFVPKPSRNDV